MVACEMPLAAASFLKSASQGSKGAVLRQFAWPKAPVGAPSAAPPAQPKFVASLALSLSALVPPCFAGALPDSRRRASAGHFLLVRRALLARAMATCLF